MLKIIIIIIGYSLNNFTTHYNIVVDDENTNNFKILKTNSFFDKKNFIRFVNVKTDPMLG
jgi:hypothetical protein